MVSDIMAVQHNCEGLLKFILTDDTVTVDMEVMTLTGVHIFRQDILVKRVLFLAARRIHLLLHF